MSDAWPVPTDTPLQRARKVATSYRRALHRIDPEECGRLDRVAIARGQGWVVPTQIPADAVDGILDVTMTPADIEHFFRIPTATLYGWASKGLLPRRRTAAGRLGFRVRDVLDVQAR